MFFDGYADRLEKDATYRLLMSDKVHSKVDLEHWDRLKSENLGEDKCCKKPLQLLKESPLRNVKDQTSACTSFPNEATSRIFLAVQLAQIQGRERNVTVEGDLKREREKGRKKCLSCLLLTSHWTRWCFKFMKSGRRRVVICLILCKTF